MVCEYHYRYRWSHEAVIFTDRIHDIHIEIDNNFVF